MSDLSSKTVVCVALLLLAGCGEAPAVSDQCAYVFELREEISKHEADGTMREYDITGLEVRKRIMGRAEYCDKNPRAAWL